VFCDTKLINFSATTQFFYVAMVVTTVVFNQNEFLKQKSGCGLQCDLYVKSSVIWSGEKSGFCVIPVNKNAPV
jgi:hypothetical protein